MGVYWWVAVAVGVAAVWWLLSRPGAEPARYLIVVGTLAIATVWPLGVAVALSVLGGWWWGIPLLPVAAGWFMYGPAAEPLVDLLAEPPWS